VARLQIALFGGIEVRLPAGKVVALPGQTAPALLGYLTVRAGRWHTREDLCALLWPHVPATQARHRLRQTLLVLRRALAPVGSRWILNTREGIAVDGDGVEVDVLTFEKALAKRMPDAMSSVAGLYRGDLLAGLGEQAGPFEDWLLSERERLRELALEGLTRLLREQARAEDPAPATGTAMRILALDPLQESVHRVLMRLLARQGRRAAALRQYQVCVELLRRELGAEPEEETRELYRDLLKTGALQVTEGAGAAPIAYVAVVAGGSAAPFVGREAELERLHATLGRVLDEGGRVALVSGEAGIGKSRLIAAFAAQAAAHGARIMVGRCHETEQVLALHPWIDALRGDRPGLSAQIRDRLGAAAGAELVRVFPELQTSADAPVTMSAQPALLFEALAELLGELAATGPLVVVIEDLHWADAMSARLLAFLGRRIERLSILVVASLRSEEIVDAPVVGRAVGELRAQGRMEEIPLHPFSRDETRSLVCALHPATRLRGEVERMITQVWKNSEGNPFVIVESVHAYREESPAGSMGEPRLASTVQEFVAARLERPGPLARHVVAVAATVGCECPFALLARATGLSERDAAAAVEELVRRRILEVLGDQLAFAHDWIRRVAYERVLPPQRAALHASVAAALEELYRDRVDEVVDQLGHHYLRAGDGAGAIRHLKRFAWLSARRYALEDACRGYDQALVAVKQVTPAERERSGLDIVLRKAFVLSIMGRQEEILELLRAHAVHVERVADPALSAEYHFRIGLTLFFLGQHGPSQLAAEKALREAEEVGDPELIGKALHVLSLGSFEGGRPEEGIAQASRAVGMLQRVQAEAWLGLAYHDLALNCVVAGALDAALDAAEKEDAVGRETQWPRLQALAGYVTAWVLALRGDGERAIETARRSLELARDPMAASLIGGTLGYACLEQGDARSAVTLLEEAIERLKSSPLRQGQVRHMAILSEAYLLAGDVSRAREAAARALELSQSDGMRFNVGIAQRAAGRIASAAGELAEAERHLSRALETFAGSGASFEAARTRMDLAAVTVRRGNQEAAREHLCAALAVFDGANAPKRAAQAHDVARACGIELSED
jgi:DNA-binding SARP family transcriptional activator/tetratricopeptide (TPR) repeat protein